MRTLFTRILLLLLLLVGCTGKGGLSAKPESHPNHQWSQTELNILKNMSLLGTPPGLDQSNSFLSNPDAINLGKQIFFDKRFSINGTISCASCHQPDKYFTDGLDRAKGLGKISRNTPTVVGASRHTWFFHDGRSDSLWSQALVPMENELEHGGNRGYYVNLIFTDSSYRIQYESIFGTMPDLSDKERFPVHAGPVKDAQARNNWQSMREEDQNIITRIFVNIGKSIAAFETQLQPLPSRFDQYVQAAVQNEIERMLSLLSKDEVDGLRLFIGKANCFICHNGPMLSDYQFHNVNTPPIGGEKFDWGRYRGAQEVLKSEFNCRSIYSDKKNSTCEELKYIVTEQDETMGSIKTPSLRNVSKTAPYMHAGQYKTLKDVIEHYNDPPPLKYRLTDLLDIDLNDTEIKQLESFLLALDSGVKSK